MSDETLKIVLVVGGWTLETSGIVLIAAAELVPRLRRLGSAVLARTQRIGNTIRGWVGLPPRANVVYGAGTSTVRATMSGSGVVSISADAPIDRQLAFLREQVETFQRQIAVLESTVRELPERWRQDLATARNDVAASFRAELEASRNEYIGARLLGLPLVVVGATMLAVSSFV